MSNEKLEAGIRRIIEQEYNLDSFGVDRMFNAGLLNGWCDGIAKIKQDLQLLLQEVMTSDE